MCDIWRMILRFNSFFSYVFIKLLNLSSLNIKKNELVVEWSDPTRKGITLKYQSCHLCTSDKLEREFRRRRRRLLPSPMGTPTCGIYQLNAVMLTSMAVTTWVITIDWATRIGIIDGTWVGPTVVNLAPHGRWRIIDANLVVLLTFSLRTVRRWLHPPPTGIFFFFYFFNNCTCICHFTPWVLFVMIFVVIS